MRFISKAKKIDITIKAIFVKMNQVNIILDSIFLLQKTRLEMGMNPVPIERK